MKSFLAIDPGISTGWAVLDDHLQLMKCGAGTPPLLNFAVVLIERPTIYPYSKADPANIITLAIGAGRYEERYGQHGATVKWVEPRHWKGQVDKKIHHPRIYAICSPAEKLVVDAGGRGLNAKALGDMMDAVGLAQYGRTFHVFT